MPNPRVKQKTRGAVKAKTKSPFEIARPFHERDDEVDMESEMCQEEEEEDHDVPEKDDTERKLEKLLFGDDEGFHEALKNQRGHEVMDLALQSDDGEDSGEGNNDGIEGEDRGLEDVPDADLFFLDSGTAPVETDIVEVPGMPDGAGSDEEEMEDAPAVWHDSDDERLTISLANQARLRKLRVTESEDLISGKEYTKRLRRLYQQLHPVPDWANPDIVAKQRQKAISAGDDDSDADGVDEMDIDNAEEETMSMQPLARLLQSATDLTKIEGRAPSNGKRKLRQEVLGIQRLKDVGGNQPSSIDSLSFHPHYPLILSSGPASTLYLHHISPQAPAPNPLLTSLHVRRTPIHTSAFALPSGNKIFFAGRRRYFQIWDLDTGKVDKVNGTADRKQEQKSMEWFKLSPCGRYIGLAGTSRKGGGLINILNSGTAQWIAEVRVDGRGGVADFAWWSDGEGMTVASKNGEVSEWDGQQRRVIARWVDEGAVGTTVLSLGGRSGRKQLGGDRWVAIGSSSGIVNIYDRREWVSNANAHKKNTPVPSSKSTSKDQQQISETGIPRNPKPTRALDNLTTPISHLIFSPDGQLLVMASRWKRDALRIIHLPSCTVYRNWPTSNTPLGRISSVAISPDSTLLSVANEQGRIRLWEING